MHPKRSILFHTYVKPYSSAFQYLIDAVPVELCALAPKGPALLSLIGFRQILEAVDVAPCNLELHAVFPKRTILPKASETILTQLNPPLDLHIFEQLAQNLSVALDFSHDLLEGFWN